MRLGTRGSALALAQARWVAQRIGEHAEIVEITTLGDRGASPEDKSRWTSELERALHDGRIDLAVHSAKDVPGELAPGTEIVAIPRREDPRDVICGVDSLAALPAGASVGTSSLRRAAQLRALRPDLAIVELRGNVDTRLRKLAEGDADAIVLAAAGLRRLEREAEIGGVLTELVPAPGQGALIVQGRVGDPVSARVADGGLDDTSARFEVTAERAFAHALGASCLTPLGASATATFGSVRLSGWIGLPDGSHWIADSVTGPFDEVGRKMAERMLAAGAGEILGAEIAE
jgi:hydroxymethylbilane synthase